MSSQGFFNVAPSAARLIESLRDIGYDFPTAIADIVDNSIAAGAKRVEIDITFNGAYSVVSISDDGQGMTANGLLEALRFGSRRGYERGDLGRYGLGLKTASLSQCRSLTVMSRKRGASRAVVRAIDLDVVAEMDEWLVVSPTAGDPLAEGMDELVPQEGGTAVVWRKLDRVLPEKRPEGGWARRRLEGLASRTAQHLGIVFHRFIEGTYGEPLVITVNGEKIAPWNPFAPNEPARSVLPLQQFEVSVGEASGKVSLQCVVLPSRDQFSSPLAFEKMSGPSNWNRQQGLYIYRAGRLVQWGGWAGIRGIDEHTKLARAALDFDTDLDVVFNINVAKMRVTMPPQLRQLIERPINELCIRADAAYRKTTRSDRPSAPAPPKGEQLALPVGQDQPASERPNDTVLSTAGLALRAAAMQAGEYPAWQRIAETLKESAPDVAEALGLSR